MLPKKITILISLCMLINYQLVQAQVCTTLGQNPSTAFPVCGTAVFFQDSVPICSSNRLYVPGCSIYGDTATTYSNKNPFWYKFTCFQSGTLSFIIDPNAPFEDYDWQLYDITGHNPDDVYTDTSLIVTGNWSGTFDTTGASATGVNYIQCSSYASEMMPTFAKSPNLIQGHNYLLLVSHFSDNEQGYSLSFGGGTAVITDTLPPHMFTASRATCDGSKILLKLNKKMRCNSLASDGSDFSISPNIATITSAVGTGCNSAFEMDEVLLTFSNPLPFGNYELIAHIGSDNNTILDLCYNGIPDGETLEFTVLSPQPVPMDSLTFNRCKSDSLVLVFPDNIQCNSVAPDGSDFSIAGPYPVQINQVNPVNCNNGLTRSIVVHFSQSLLDPGNFQIILQVGTDGNTLLSECDTPSVAGSAIPFAIVAKPVAGFGFPDTVCLPAATISFENLSTIADGSENTLQYLWNFNDPFGGNNNSSTLKNPTHTYTSTGPFPVNLRVTSSGGCISDTTLSVNSIHPQPLVNFGISKSAICLGDAVYLTDSTNSMDGITIQWNWDMGDGMLRNTQNVLYVYNKAKNFQPSLYTVNSFGCKSELLSKPIIVYPYPIVNAGPDKTVLEGGSLTFKAEASGTDLQFLWTPRLFLSDYTILKPTCINPTSDIVYTITVTGSGGCVTSDEVYVKILKTPQIPNTFSPNNDGINDFWVINKLDDYVNNHVQVFTRAGQLVFESHGPYQAWDGTYKGKILPMDTYYYIIEPGSGRSPLTGFITIIK